MPRSRFHRFSAALAGAAALMAPAAMVEAAQPIALPIPCAPGACGPSGAKQFVTSGAATAVATPGKLTVNQTSNAAILNWSSFNVGAGGAVNFKQPGAGAIALNRIYQSSPAQIFGSLSANGEVYLINLNGFVFGPTSTVNVGSLLVSSLPLTLSDANFSNGILSPVANDLPILDATCAGCDPLAPGGRTSVLDANGNPVLGPNGQPLPVEVVVQPGAAMAAADQGRLLLAGQSVTNGGALSAPDGQIILAAGKSVFLQASDDPSLRGLVVEVDADKTNVAWNQLTGSLAAARGNITMVGLAVNQDGRVSATTSVSANGSIRLEAAQGATFSGSGTVASSAGGTLTVGRQSYMDILPETSSSATEVADQPQLPSSITLLGEQVVLQGGSIVAPNGNLTAIAAANPSAATLTAAGATVIAGVSSTPDPNARLRIDPGSSIDLAGSTATLPMSANLVEAQLRASELADDPTQRNGPLHGLTVYVDARDPPPAALANVSGEIAAVPQSVAQRTEGGGTAVFQSEGDAVFAAGATINVSGGSTTYTGGVLQTTYLVGSDGRLYPIATANPLLSYVGVVNPTVTRSYNSWGVQETSPVPGLSAYQPGYVQGAAAGSVQFVASTMVLEGTLQGSAVNGLYQRTPSTAVGGGQLIIGLPGGAGGSSNGITDFVSPAVRFATSPTPVIVADDAELPGALTLELPLAYLTTSGFTSTQIYSNYGVNLPAGTPLVMPAGSTLSIDAARVDVLSNVTDPGGSLNFQNVFNVGSAAAVGPRSGVFIGDGVILDVRGQWTNDVPTTMAGGLALSPTWQNGGSISLGVITPGALLSVGNDVSLRVSGGAWLNAASVLTTGSGGSISLNEDAVLGGLDVGNNVVLDGFGVNGAAGGTFNLSAPRVEISAGSGNWATGQQVDDTLFPGDVLQLHPSLFSGYGFQNMDINASGAVVAGAPSSNLVTVDAGTAINATVSTLFLNSSALLHASAPNLDGLASATLQPEYLRQAAKLTLSAIPPGDASNTAQTGTSAGNISIGSGASINTDAGGSISLTDIDSIVVAGALSAPGGTVSLHVLSPPETFEAGFLPDQRIELGATGSIDVTGTFVPQPSALGLTLGTVYGGGTVDLFADRGALVTDAGSRISVAGTTAPEEVLQPDGFYAHEVAATAGGSIYAHSGESISLLGAIDAVAGSGGTTGPAAAGSLDLALTRSESWWGVSNQADVSTFNSTPLTVILTASVSPAGAPSAAASNQAFLGVAQLAQSGLDALTIEAGGALQFSGATSLSLGRQFVVDAPVLAAYAGAQTSVTAPYLEVGYEVPSGGAPNANVASGGSGALNFSGSQVDLVGTTVFQGASQVRFTSAGDLVLRGQPLGSGLDTLVGGMTVAGSLTLDAARIYPLTATSFAFEAVDAPGLSSSVTIGQSSPNPGTPLSAGGAVSIMADAVTSTGTLYAPFGTISLAANTSLTLADGSLTSVSGAGLIVPFGQTEFGGEQWIYVPPGASPQSVTEVPARAVSLTAPVVALTSQATINLSGGGDLSAYEWVPGTGGTTDALTSNPAVQGYNPNLYAILPSTRGQSSPQDPQNSSASTIAAGESVYLSVGAGLAAGFYPLLPARYALVPGSYLIELEPKTVSATPGVLGALADGTPVVAGYLTYGSTGLHQSPGYTGFAVYPGAYGSELANYDQSLASTFFLAAANAAANATASGGAAVRPTLPADAGSLSIAVTGTVTDAVTGVVTDATAPSLELAGQVLTAAAASGIAAPISISANDLLVGTPSALSPPDVVSISGAVISGWQAGSLLLGGTATPTAATPTASGAAASTVPLNPGTTINVVANTVTIGAGSSVTADQISLVAAQSIEVQEGATLQSTSATGGASKTLPLMQPVTLLGAAIPPSVPSGSGGSNNPPSVETPALLAVSDLNWLIPIRQAGIAPPGAATIAVDAGASIGSHGALTVDALGAVALNGSINGPGAEWSLASSSIAFAPRSTSDALSIGTGLTAQLGSAAAVRIASTGSVDVFMPVTLGVNAGGAPTLQSLTLVASSINNLSGVGGMAAPVTAQFGAQTLTLEGSGAVVSPALAGPTGANLELAAVVLDVGPNAFEVNGFATTHLSASGAVVGQGAGSADGLYVGGDLGIAAAAVTAASGSQTTFNATGALSIAPGGGGSAAVPRLLGGALAFAADSIDISGTVAAPSGVVTAQTPGNLTLEDGAKISTAGSVVGIQNQTVGTPGGSIALTATGNLTLNPGATLDVSGADAAAGGAISLSAGGAATVGGALKGSGGSGGATGGSFSLDAQSLVASNGAASSLDSLAASLSAGGFNEALNVRVATGNLALDEGQALTANSIFITADSGQLTVSGTITADSGALRGALSLFGGAGVELTATGSLVADGVGTAGLGGAIEIGAGQLMADANGILEIYNQGAIRLDPGSSVATAGTAANGTVLLRAPALISTGDVGIASLASTLSGVGQLTVEPVLPFSTANLSSATAPTAADLQQVQQSVASYMSVAGATIAGRLTPAGGAPFVIEPGVELIAPGALTLQSADGVSPALDLSTWRFNGAPVDFTVRAAGNLTVANTLTDGFVGVNGAPILLPGSSSSIRLVAGADLSSANPLSVVPGAAAGTLTLGLASGSAPTYVRTGTGDIDLVASGNIVIGNAGSGAYTAGVPAIAPGGTAANPYPNIPSGLGQAQTGTDLNGNAYVAGILIPDSSLLSFPTAGGNLLVSAGADIVGAALGAPGVPTWQLREGGGKLGGEAIPAEWGVNLGAYDWNFGTLGGGDLRLSAAGDILNVTAAAAGSLLPQYAGGPQYVNSGGLSLTAGGNIGSAQVFLANGTGTIAAGGALTAVLPSSNPSDPNVGAAFYLQASSLDVTARAGMAIDGVYNPTELGQGSNAKPLVGGYLSYGDTSALNLDSASGDVVFGAASAAAPTLLGLTVSNASSQGLQVFPAGLSVEAPSGNIVFGSGIGNGGAITLFPSPHGQLNLLAALDIDATRDPVSLVLGMSDAAPGSYANVANPLGLTAVDSTTAAFNGNLHVGDSSPAMVTAGEDVLSLSLSIPKPSQVVAGGSLQNITYLGENLQPSDQTVLMAGLNVAFTSDYNGNGISVGGPGQLDIIAGRSVSLGFSSNGIVTTGNLLNANLPTAQGADLTIVTGVAPIPALAASVVSNMVAPSSSDRAALVNYVQGLQGSSDLPYSSAAAAFDELPSGQQQPFIDQIAFNAFLAKIIAPSPTYRAELVNYVNSIPGDSSSTFAAAESAFEKLPLERQRPFIDEIFFNELSLSGLAANATPRVGFTEGYAAIDTLFPGSRAATPDAVAGSYAGDLTLQFSRIYTLSGGDINLLVPGGLINAGLANPPSILAARSPSTLGIVAEGAGNVEIYTQGDVDVNASRIFTLGGGNILIWSDQGSIDAGQGAKTSISAPPPAILISSTGAVTLDFSGAAAGSGIRTIQTEPATPAGDVDLVAPVGTVNAGDAGIGAAGNINIAARSVIGATNINFGGTATGVPAQVSSVGASLSGASNAASSTTNTSTSAVGGNTAEKESQAPIAQTALSWLDVFVTGLGEENCKPDDIECLKRQKTTTR